ncbi:hypothetical protein GCM10009596_32750 [Arthrobacter rhombi]
MDPQLPRRWDPSQAQKPDPPGRRRTAGFATRNLKGSTHHAVEENQCLNVEAKRSQPVARNACAAGRPPPESRKHPNRHV